VLEFLAANDGMHQIEEISQELGIPRGVCRSIADFLSKYEFIQTEGQWLKVNPKMKLLEPAPSHDLSSIALLQKR